MRPRPFCNRDQIKPLEVPASLFAETLHQNKEARTVSATRRLTSVFWMGIGVTLAEFTMPTEGRTRLQEFDERIHIHLDVPED
jgi:hypothetical protein